MDGEPVQDTLTSTLKAELARLKREVRDDDQACERAVAKSRRWLVALLKRKSGVRVTSALRWFHGLVARGWRLAGRLGHVSPSLQVRE